MIGQGTSQLGAARPFPGLRPFYLEDHEFFFGREQQINALYRLLDFSPFVAVVGSSGSGKSSLVRAGLLPLLQNEAQQPGGRKWRFASMHPGDAPTEALADALFSLAPGADRERILTALRSSSFGLVQSREALGDVGTDPIFLIVDQFEELFRYAAFGNPAHESQVAQSLWLDRAGHFVQLILEATRKRSAEIYVLITIRSDFIGDCAQFPYLPEAVSGSQFLVPGLTREQRESVIRCPIDKVAETIEGAMIEPALVQRLLNDIGDEVDQLPVLQHCLSRLWEFSGDWHRLTLEGYKEIGEVADALSDHADEIMRSLPGFEIAVEQLFRALSEVDKDGRATRRAVPYGRLVAECGVPEEQLRAVVDRFREDDCSFLIPSPASSSSLRTDTRIDVGHEALLRHWCEINRVAGATDEAQGWLWDEERDGRRYRALLVTSNVPLAQAVAYAEWWEARPRTAAWAERYGGEFARVERLILESREKFFEEQRNAQLAAARERDAQLRSIRQTRIFAGLMAIIAIIAVVFGISAYSAQQLATASKQTADATIKMMEEHIALSSYGGPTVDESIKDKAEYQRLLPDIADPSVSANVLGPIARKLEHVLAAAYGSSIPFKFYVTTDSNRNDSGAYAFYGPRIYVSSAMVTFAGNADQLAGIICHVSAHIVNHSGAVADRLTNQTVLTAYEQAEEEAADLSGAILCSQAGINPWGLDALLRKLHEHPAFDEDVSPTRLAVLQDFLQRSEFSKWPKE